VSEGVPVHLLPVGSPSAFELIRRGQARDAWFAERGLGDRQADAGERNRLTRLGLDRAGAVFEDARLLLRFGEHDPTEVVTIRESLRADGTPRPYSARTPPGWRTTSDQDEENA
jgi:hypothetical protein